RSRGGSSRAARARRPRHEPSAPRRRQRAFTSAHEEHDDSRSIRDRRRAARAARDLLTGRPGLLLPGALTMRASLSLGLAIFFLSAMNAGCGGGNGPDTGGYDDLFSAPGGAATPDRLQGLWGGGAD